jgi:non-heme chloroperoxidase
MTHVVEREFVGFGGVGLAASCYGDPGAPAVVLSHGAGQTRHAWTQTAERLAGAGFFAVAIDMRGHGDSQWAADGRYDRDALLGDLVAVCDELGRPAALVGASTGGLTSLVAVGEGVVQVEALVLVDVAPRIEEEGAERIVSFMAARPDGFDDLEDAADTIAGYLPGRRKPSSLDGLRKNLRKGPDGRWRWHWDPTYLDGALADRVATEARAEEAAQRLQCPTLLVRGALSDVVSLDGVRAFLRAAPGARYVDVSDAGHMVAGDQNDAFGAEVIGFLESCRPAPVNRRIS